MKCPACQVELTMAERQGVEIDYCPQCRGIWLDRGELDKIIERAASQPVRHPDSGERREHEEHDRYDHDDDRDDYGRKRRRKGFLGDLFDF